MKSIKCCINFCLVLGILLFGVLATAVWAESQLTSAVNYADKTIDELQVILGDGKRFLSAFNSEANQKTVLKSEAKQSSGVDDNMRQLQQVVLVAAERARRLADWDLGQVEKNAEEIFDTTIQGIEEYLSLVEEDGPVHKAKNKIRKAALEQERTFREKSIAKSSVRYSELAGSMKTQAERADAVWESIKAQRETAIEGLRRLKDSRELYIDIKKAQGIEAAVQELENVKNDLVKLSDSMAQVQEAILSTGNNI